MPQAKLPAPPPNQLLLWSFGLPEDFPSKPCQYCLNMRNVITDLFIFVKTKTDGPRLMGEVWGLYFNGWCNPKEKAEGLTGPVIVDVLQEVTVHHLVEGVCLRRFFLLSMTTTQELDARSICFA